MTCFSDSFDYEFVQWKRDTSGRVVSVAIKVNNYCINIVNIYAPTNLTERKVFFGNLHEFFCLPTPLLSLVTLIAMNTKLIKLVEVCLVPNILPIFDQLFI